MKYKRWVGLGNYNLDGLVKVARNCGMKIITAFKPAMHFYYEIGLSGNKKQIEQVDNAWRLGNHKVVNRCPGGACGFNVNIAKTDWADNAYKTII